jgi:hypothetical protein
MTLAQWRATKSQRLILAQNLANGAEALESGR